ncbi:putative sulfate exporter family transporter [Sphingobium sp. JS3065]|uniref:YeiH family protein n=1 Tax=Sphingobium sp. JS3065 TaxID=2970925 RepID=UPI002263AF58|nr:putative sulfate exporter family transporter [Sphingobium sp. JS3065]UZW55485.1 putative sulfate exporter family transporter [Sphingobium sp. JS3065]
MALTIGSGVLAARWLKLDRNFGLLAGGSVAICGASAAMALATTLGSRRVNDASLSLVLVGISAMSAAAMMLYPIAAHMLGLSDMQAGFLLGASIHDVAQALGAGYAYSVGAGQVAAIVKLSRVALLPAILAIITLFLRDDRRESIGVPWFVLGFFCLAGVNSLGLIPPVAAGLSAKAASAFLAAAVTATAIPLHWPA